MSTVAALSNPVPGSTTTFPELRVIRGRAEILRYQTTLQTLCRLNGQDGEADNLNFFLSTRDALRKRPCLLLFQPPYWSSAPTVDGFSGAVIIFEYMLGPLGLRIFATADYSGRRNIFGREQDRAAMAVNAGLCLVGEGAQAVLIDFQAAESKRLGLPQIREMLSLHADAPAPFTDRLRWSLETREIPLYLQLQRTFDATLAHIGQKTRANLRYYRRRAEAQLGCTFVPHVELSLEEFQAINRASRFAVPDGVASDRWHSIKRLKYPSVCGLRAADGRWLSLVCGWRRRSAFELLWQMNLASLPEYSLATVMRSYLIDYAISLGYERLYIEGGTNQAIQQSFITEPVAEITLLRGTYSAQLLQRYARWLMPKDNHIGSILARRDLCWHDAGPAALAADIRTLPADAR